MSLMMRQHQQAQIRKYPFKVYHRKDILWNSY
nr:MAG TPA: hypothetical protein [Caudoviricetes sp.]